MFLVSSARNLWPNMAIEDATQKLFNDYLSKEPTFKTILLTEGLFERSNEHTTL